MAVCKRRRSPRIKKKKTFKYHCETHSQLIKNFGSMSSLPTALHRDFIEFNLIEAAPR